MKIRRILLLFVIVFISVFLIGCKEENNENYLSGTELAKKMLSNERLDANGLKAGDNIFTKGSKDFRELSRKTLESVRSSNTNILKETSAIRTGNKITWTNIGPSTNAISYFNNLTEVISSNAIAVASIIDETKTNVRIVDKWIKIGENKILLTVDENSETIYSKEGSSTRICTRSKNNYGQNVYDVFISNSETGYNIRMKYIPNTRYEMYEETSFGDNLLFIADRTKGYWEAVVISEYSTHYNFQTIVMKSDLTYTYNYNVDEDLLNSITIINGERTTDIINFNGSTASLYLGSLAGIKSIEIETNSIISPTSGKEGDVYEFEDGSYATTGRKSATINLTNGNKIEEFDTYVDGKIEVGRTLVLTGAQGYSAELMIKIGMKEVVVEGDPVVDPNNPDNYIPGRPITEYQEYSLDEKMDFIKQFLNEAGFSYSYNFNYIISSLKYASSEMNSFVDYYKINGYKVNSRSELSKAFNEERAKHRDIKNKINSYSSYEEIDINDQDKIKDNMLFPSVKNITSSNVTNNGSQIKVTNLSLTIDNTMLMVVDNEQYTIGIGVVDISTDIINYYPVYLGNENITYSGTDTFTASTTGEFNVSVDEEGEYSLVAYIATKEGIRVSEPVYIPFSNINQYKYSQNRLECTYTLNSDNYLIIKQSYLNDVNVSATLSEVNTYELLDALLTEYANEYGIVEQYDIYTLQGEEWVKLDKETASIVEGSYKLEFLIFNAATDSYSPSSVILNLK